MGVARALALALLSVLVECKRAPPSPQLKATAPVSMFDALLHALPPPFKLDSLALALPPLSPASLVALVVTLIACLLLCCRRLSASKAASAAIKAEAAFAMHDMTKLPGERESIIEHALCYFEDPSAGTNPEATWKQILNTSAGLHVHHYCDGVRHAIKLKMHFDVDADVLIATAREIDLMPTWNKYVIWACLCEEYTDTSVRVAAQIWTPPFFQKICAVVNATLDDITKTHGCFLIMSASPDPPAPPVPPELEGMVQIPTHGLMRYTPCAEGGTTMELVNHLPASMVPSWVLELILYVATPWTHRAAVAMLEVAMRPGTPLCERILNGTAADRYRVIRENSASVRLRRQQHSC